MTQADLKNNPHSSLLKDTRMAKGLTLEIVHEATKIPMDALKAIEEGYSTRILTPFYYRGFLKIYAEFLGLNSAEVLKEYSIKSSEAKTPQVQPSSARSIKPKPAPSAAPKGPNPLAESFQEFWRTFWVPKTQRNLLRIAVFLIALFVVVKIVGCVAGFISARSKAPKAKVAAQAPAKALAKKQPVKQEADEDEEEAAALAEAKKEKAFASQNQNHRVTLAVHAPKASPIQVKVDGKVVFPMMTMKKGTMENWEAKNEIELSGRNIGDLDLEVNGRDIDLGSRRVKRVVITKDGLTVKR